MVLEAIINPLRAEKRPWEMFFIGFVYASVAIFLGNWIFKEHASLLMVFFTTIACIPFVYSQVKKEERKDIIIQSERSLLKEHSKAIIALTMLFIGFVIAYVLWYCVLPSHIVQTTYQTQTLTIQSINIAIAGSYLKFKTFTTIFLNNLKVMIFCVLFSFLYGMGAIFILAWNASVIATAIGNFIRANISFYVGKAGFAQAASYFQIISIGLLRYSLHGIPEIIAYFIAGLAGGIISVAVIRESFGTRKFSHAILDTTELLMIAITILLIAAILEVYVTPLIF